LTASIVSASERSEPRRHAAAPVDTIAQQVGYSSQYTFTHTFKRQYGSPPGSYRHHAGRSATPA
jgi:AraC-like DNA-binding protein